MAADEGEEGKAEERSTTKSISIDNRIYGGKLAREGDRIGKVGRSVREGQRWKLCHVGKPSDSTSPSSILPSHPPRRFSHLPLILLLILCCAITLSLSLSYSLARSLTQSSSGRSQKER